jgi:sugar transferase (PEP-CTERM/EpsH1 system associated)
MHVLHSFGFGGLEKGIATIIRHGSKDFEHIVLCLAGAGESKSLLPEGTPLVKLNKSEGSSMRFVFDLSRKIRCLKPDVVHTRNWGGMDGIIASNFARLGRKVVQGEHGWAMEDAYGKRKKRLLIRRSLSLGVKQFTCVSGQMQKWLREEVKVFRPVTRIYNGIDTVRFSPTGPGSALRRELGLARSTLLVACVGRLDPIKNHIGLIEAFRRSHGKYTDSALAIVGDGPERERLAATKAPGVYLVGARYDIPEILRAADLFVLASFNEGISNTILEAMATGLPVVSTDAGGTPELISHGRNGLLSAPNDIDMLASHMLAYFRNPEMRIEHGRLNRRIAENKFGIRNMVEGYEQVWHRVAGV